jgi:hypothetical protein
MVSPMNINDYDWNRLQGLGLSQEFFEKMKDDPCWKGYQMVGKKKKGGKQVPNCVPIKKSEHAEGEYNYDKDSPLNSMTARDLPAATVAGGGDEKNPQLSEGVPQTMPRMEVIKKNMSRDGEKAMAMPPNSNFAETEDFHDAFHSMESNGGMAINQLRVMREKIDIMLGMLYPDDNLEPWCATKLSMSAQNLASVCDYLRYGAET